jgi:hypothetical protein
VYKFVIVILSPIRNNSTASRQASPRRQARLAQGKDLGRSQHCQHTAAGDSPAFRPAILAVSRGDYALVFAVAGAVAVLGAAVLVQLENVL